MSLANTGEEAFICTSKDLVVTESRLGCLLSYLYHSLGSTLRCQVLTQNKSFCPD